jgi:hypothetical protein
MKKLLTVGLVVLVLAAIPAVAVATTSGGQSPINCATSQWTSTPVSTSSSSFTTIPSLTVGAASIYPMAITVSAVVRGAPVRFRLLDSSVAGTLVVAPGPVPYAAPSGTYAPFSFTWTDPGSGAAVRWHSIAVQWKRASSSGSATISRADISFTYRADGCPGSN